MKEPADTDNVLVKEEEKEVGVVAFSVYRSYCMAVGVLLTPIILLSLFLMQGAYTLYSTCTCTYKTYIVLYM